jgi:NADH-quinone oxidoreductase subunit J
MTAFLFTFLGTLAVLIAATLITRRNPISAAMLLIVDFVILAVMFGLLDAHFAAATQVIVYAGAIMVVFVFMIMMLNIPIQQIRFGKITVGEWILLFLGVAAATGTSLAMTGGQLQAVVPVLQTGTAHILPFPESENTRNVAASMFTTYLWAFELVGFLIIAAMIGAVVVTKRRKSA